MLAVPFGRMRCQLCLGEVAGRVGKGMLIFCQFKVHLCLLYCFMRLQGLLGKRRQLLNS